MDILKKLPAVLMRYKYAVLVLLLGLVLMVIPTGQKGVMEESAEPPTESADITQALTDILSQIEGVGNVRVMLTEAAGESVVYRKDDDGNTVIITGDNRAESGLIEQTVAPVYQGAIIVCQGADSASVRLAVIQAVAHVTGLTTDRISVLKMK